MFRDLKEYQEIAKIYAEKVSKPAEAKSDELVENQENRNKLKLQRTKRNEGRVEKQFGFLKPKPRNLKDGQTSVRQSGVNDPRRKKDTPIPSTDQIRKENPGVQPGTRVNEIGAEGGGKPSEGNFKKDFPDKEKKVEVSNLTKQGKERTPAQIAAAKRIASGKTIQQVKDENLQSIKNKAKLKNTDFQAMKKGDMSKDDFVKKYPNSNLAKKMKEGYELDERELQEKKVKPAPVKAPDMKYIMSHGMSDETFVNTANKHFSGKGEVGKDGYSTQNRFTAELMRRQSNTGKDFSGNPLYKKKEESKSKADVKSSYEYDAYDLVLEYLLSTEQAATIEEANYVMTEMDAETIQSIVEAQKKTS